MKITIFGQVPNINGKSILMVSFIVNYNLNYVNSMVFLLVLNCFEVLSLGCNGSLN